MIFVLQGDDTEDPIDTKRKVLDKKLDKRLD